VESHLEVLGEQAERFCDMVQEVGEDVDVDEDCLTFVNQETKVDQV